MHTIAFTTLIFLPISTVAVSPEPPALNCHSQSTDNLRHSILQLHPIPKLQPNPPFPLLLDSLDLHRPSDPPRPQCLALLPPQHAVALDQAAQGTNRRESDEDGGFDGDV